MKHIRSIATCTVLSLALISACSTKPAASAATDPPVPAGAGLQPVASHVAKGGGASGTPAASVVQVTEPIQPAEGGLTVANIVANRKALAGKTVTVRGKVVKYNGGILGLNWIHIQDGSGVEKDGTNDLTVTSAAAAKVGDVVTITGTVVLDKDFGSGYSYTVLLQNASITVK